MNETNINGMGRENLYLVLGIFLIIILCVVLTAEMFGYPVPVENTETPVTQLMSYDDWEEFPLNMQSEARCKHMISADAITTSDEIKTSVLACLSRDTI